MYSSFDPLSNLSHIINLIINYRIKGANIKGNENKEITHLFPFLALKTLLKELHTKNASEITQFSPENATNWPKYEFRIWEFW